MADSRVLVEQYRERARKVRNADEARAVTSAILTLLAREFDSGVHQVGCELVATYDLSDLKLALRPWATMRRKRRKRPSLLLPSLDEIDELPEGELSELRDRLSEMARDRPGSAKIALRLGAVLLRLRELSAARAALGTALDLTLRPDLRGADSRAFAMMEKDARRKLTAVQELLDDHEISNPVDAFETSSDKGLRTLVFSPWFQSTPSLRGEGDRAEGAVKARHLAGPVIITLSSYSAYGRVPVRIVLADYIAWRSVTQHGNIPTPLRCPVVRSEAGEVSLYVGAWLIPLEVFGPGVALRPEHRAVSLHAPTDGCRWEDCRLEPVPDDEAWVDGWFSAAPTAPKRRRYAVRSIHGGWLRWLDMSFYQHRFAALQIGMAVRFKVALVTGASGPELVATDLFVTGDSAGDPNIVRSAVIRSPGTPARLRLGALEFPLFSTLQVPNDVTTVDIKVTIFDGGKWSFERPGLVKGAGAAPSAFRNSVERVLELLTTDPEGATAEFGKAFAEVQRLLGRRLSRENDRWLASIVAAAARSAARSRRVPALTKLIAALLSVPARDGQGETRYPWVYRYILAMTHFLAGLAIVECADGTLRVDSDPLARALAAYPEFSINQAFFHDGLALCFTLAALGDLGYRLNDLHLYRGCCSLDLLRDLPSPAGLPESLRVVAQYGHTDDIDATLRELLRAAPTGHARALIVCVNDPAAPGNLAVIRRSQSLAVLESAAFSCPDARSLADWAEQTARTSLAYNSIVPNPINAFSQEARSLSPTQFIGRPMLLADLQNALEAAREPLGIFSMRKAGKSATAMLLSTTFRFQHHFVTIGREWKSSDGESMLSALLRRIDDQIILEERKPLLILDEFDTFCRELSISPRATALSFLTWLEDHARKHPVLCIGLDASTLRAVYPESNPLQTLRLFLLPYFTLDETREFAAALGRQLIIPELTVVRIYTLAGGHPVVMLNLFQFALSAGLGYPPTTQFIPANTVVNFTDELWWGLQSDFGAPHADASLSRYNALERLLETRGSRYPSVSDPWLLLEALALRSDDVYATADVARVARDVLRTSGKDPNRSPAEVVNQLIHWGLLRQTANRTALEFGLPLLRVELSKGTWTCPLPN